jgi:Putative peptidoglycan binding domain
MEALICTEAYAAYEETIGIEYELPAMTWDWKQIPRSTWLGSLTAGVLLATLSGVNPAFALRVNTPHGGCLHARGGPGTQFSSEVCVPNGATLLPVTKRTGSWLQLSSGRWVYGPYTTDGNSGTGGTVLLRKGARGETVRKVQLRLLDFGYSIGASGADGIYGNGTENAVRQFQAKNGLPVDGIVGSRTLKVLGLSI